MPYISIRNWRKFQHYDPAKRAPTWIKLYPELLDDHAFAGLTSHQQLVLWKLWLMYAKTRCNLTDNTAILSRQLGERVPKRTLDSLNHAGFIDIVASNVLADGYQPASPEVEVEVEKEEGFSRREGAKQKRPVSQNSEKRETLNLETMLKEMPK